MWKRVNGYHLRQTKNPNQTAVSPFARYGFSPRQRTGVLPAVGGAGGGGPVVRTPPLLVLPAVGGAGGGGPVVGAPPLLVRWRRSVHALLSPSLGSVAQAASMTAANQHPHRYLQRLLSSHPTTLSQRLFHPY